LNQHIILALALAAMPTTQLLAEDRVEQEAMTTTTDQMLSDAIERGKLLYEFDQAAWHSTDAFVGIAGDVSKLPLVGRIVVPIESGLQAIYYGKSQQGRFALFRATWNGTAMVDPVYTDGKGGAALSPEANAYAEILEQLTSGRIDTTDLWFCNNAKPNFALLPGDLPGEFLLYFMTAQEKSGSYPLGGHHRFDIKDGKVIAKRAFTKSCIEMDKEATGGQLAGFFITHLLDPVPTEIHVFTAIASKKAVFVGTNGGKSWSVEPRGASAHIVGMEKDKAK
jgi:hypothetical protein